MSNQARKWEILDKSSIIDHRLLFSILLKNRGFASKKDREEFLNPTDPMKISLRSLGVDAGSVQKAVERIKSAKKNNEFVIIYGDYDADGITATAILWETLHEAGINVLPFIPDRFEDGYGIKPASIERLKSKFPNLSLIITVDNGIVAYDGVRKAKDLGIDTVVIDHHQKGKLVPAAHCLIYSTRVCGSALAWFFSKELAGKLGDKSLLKIAERLGLAAIGTVADQISLTGVNRSVVKFGLEKLESTQRPGLIELFRESGLKQGSEPCSVDVYEINYIIAPRINAMGRLKNGIESLRLLCTKNKQRALEIAGNVGRTNKERQKIVDEVLFVARKKVTNEKVIVVAGDNYHEGVIGLAAGKLVEEFYRPSIVLSITGEVAKASARSVAGFNIIEAIRSVNLHLEGGGHPMAAGFSIKSDAIEKFSRAINKYAASFLTDELLLRKLKIDCNLNFSLLGSDLIKGLKEFGPFGLGNPEPVFLSKEVEVVNAAVVGRDLKHLKLKLKQNEHIIDSIYFGGGEMYSEMVPGSKVDVVYSIEENAWNGYRNIQLKIKDVRPR